MFINNFDNFRLKCTHFKKTFAGEKTKRYHVCLMRNSLFPKAFDSRKYLLKMMEMKVKNDVWVDFLPCDFIA